MKKVFVCLFIFLFTGAARSQSVGINTDGSLPHASAMLDINSTDKGLLMPRMTAAQRTAIAAPAEGLMVYQTDGTTGFYYFRGGVWNPLSTWTLSTPSVNASGSITVNGTSGSGGPVTTAGNLWISASNPVGTNSLAATGFLGSSTNIHLDLVTNSVVRGRLTNLGEFFIGTTNTLVAGDLMGVVSNTTLPWAISGYSSFGGSGVYGQIASGITTFPGVLGEYNGTGTTGAGVRGIITSTASGTSFSSVVSGLSGIATSAGSFKFGVHGSGGTTTRSGGVIGYDYGFAGALGYNALNLIDYSVYGFGGAYQVGLGTGRPANPNDVNIVEMDNPNTNIGIGIYGGVMGGWVRGLKYGFNTKGETYSLYVDGKSYINEPLTYLMPTDTDDRVAGFMVTSMQPEVSIRGKVVLQEGRVYVAFDDNFKKVITGNPDDIMITATPQGNSNGVYVDDITNDGFWINENNSGHSNVQIVWTAISAAKTNNPEIASELLNKNFDVKMNGVMFNDNNTKDIPQSLWWDGKQIRWDTPSLKKPASEDLIKFARPQKGVN